MARTRRRHRAQAFLTLAILMGALFFAAGIAAAAETAAVQKPKPLGSGFWGRGGGKEFVDEKWKLKNGTVGPDGAWTPNPPVEDTPPKPRPPHKPQPEFPRDPDHDRHDRHRRPIIVHGGTPDVVIQQNFYGNTLDMFTAPLRADQLTYVLQPPASLRHRQPLPIVVLNPAQPVFLSRLSANGRARLTDAYHRALLAMVGQSVLWQDATLVGDIRVTMEGYAGPLFCRDFQHSVIAHGIRYVAAGSACRDPGGYWRLAYLS